MDFGNGEADNNKIIFAKNLGIKDNFSSRIIIVSANYFNHFTQ
jgi:hypothetical protein